MSVPLHIEMTLNSRVELANLVHAASDEICRLVGFDEDAMLNLGLALREATVNAMKHGNKLEESTPVHVSFHMNSKALTINITDKGDGFEFDKSADPRLPENLDKTSGRGLFLMRNFVDDVSYDHKPGEGTTVSLILNLPRDGAE